MSTSLFIEILRQNSPTTKTAIYFQRAIVDTMTYTPYVSPCNRGHGLMGGAHLDILSRVLIVTSLAEGHAWSLEALTWYNSRHARDWGTHAVKWGKHVIVRGTHVIISETSTRSFEARTRLNETSTRSFEARTRLNETSTWSFEARTWLV